MAHILQVGSKKPLLQLVALKVFSVAIKNQIRIEPEWIPREFNQQADYISRLVDHDDWILNPQVFAMLDCIWGPHTIDRFADCYNTQLVRFNSRFYSPGSEAIDTFTANWHGENNWICPPINLVPRVLRHAQACAAFGTLVIPGWPSAAFWALICPNGEAFAAFIIDWCDLPLSSELFLPGRSTCVLFNGNMPNSRVLALRFCFTHENS